MKTLFIKYLLDNNIFEAFENNLRAMKKETVEDYLQRFSNREINWDVIFSTAFDWEASPEKFWFWEIKSTLWISEVEEIQAKSLIQ